MAANDINVKLTIDEFTKHYAQQAGEISSNPKKAKIKNYATQEVAIQSAISQLNMYSNQKTLNLTEIRSVISLMNKVTSIINNMQAVLSSSNPRMAEFADKIADLEKKIRETENEVGKKKSFLKDDATKILKENPNNPMAVLTSEGLKDAMKEYEAAFGEKSFGGARGKITLKTAFDRLSKGQSIQYPEGWDEALKIYIENMLTDVKNGNKYLDKLNKELKDARSQSPEADSDIVKGNNEVTSNAISGMKGYYDQAKKSNDETANFVNATAASATQLKKQSTALGKAFKQFTLYAVIVRAAKQALKEAVRTIKELDKSLTEQAMVTGLTREQTYGLVKDYQELALQVGATTKEVASVATEYMKQGKTVKDSMVLTEAAISAAKVARVSVGDSVNYLTTALNGFRLSAEDAMLVSDKFAAVAASSATDYDELAIALSKVASQANLAGMSIDYTTALLTKGLETTREAPETMGTALKTIIARMREMTDYGKTLEDGVDVNNVETQLNYVGVSLRSANGELRSTQEVLDELGRKWKDLDTNQQAAIAKALAGTRQQSRLIALMDGYERVIELQEISERSAGATMAQAGTYLEGIEASLNRVSVAWEKIITTLTNSDMVIGLINSFARLLDVAHAFVSTVPGQLALFGSIAVAVVGLVNKKLLENEIARSNLKLQQQELIGNIEKEQQERRIQALKKAGLQIDDDKTEEALQQLEILEAQGKQQRANAQGQGSLNASANLKVKNDAEDAKRQSALDALAKDPAYQNNVKSLALLNNQNELLSAQIGLLNLQGIKERTIVGLKQAQNILTFKGFSTAAKGMSKFGIIAKGAMGWVGIAMMGITAITGLVKWVQSLDTKTEKVGKSVNKLSSEIYKINESNTALKKATSEFEKLDNKIIKTADDYKKMEELLEGAAEKIDFSEGGKKSDKETETAKTRFEISSAEEKILEIKRQQKIQENLIAEKRKEQLENLKELSKEERNKLLSSDASVAGAMRDTARANFYNMLDNQVLSSERRRDLSALGSQLIGSLGTEQSFIWANDKSYTDVLVKSLSRLKKESIEVFSTGKGSLIDGVNAYNDAIQQLDSNGIQLLMKRFPELQSLATIDNSVLSSFDRLGINLEELNSLTEVFLDMGDSVEVAWEKVLQLGTYISQGMGIPAAIKLITNGNKEMSEQLNNTITKITTGGFSNVIQEVTRSKNDINSIYETAGKWSKMSNIEKTSFIDSHPDLFKGEGGLQLKNALDTGNLAVVQQMLPQAFKKKNAELLNLVKTALETEKDPVVIAQLEDLYKEISSGAILDADLDILVQQEQKQLDVYKEFLQEQQKVLQESLETRKSAYESYFKSIEEQESQEDYESKRAKITSNLAKLGATTSASSNAQRAELEAKLTELDQEKAKEDREKARNALMENIDKEVESINKKFDELLNNPKKLLTSLNEQLQSSNFLQVMAHSKDINGGLTDLQYSNFLETLASAFHANLSDADWRQNSNITNQNATFNMNGTNADLSQSEKQALWNVLEPILTRMGFR